MSASASFSRSLMAKSNNNDSNASNGSNMGGTNTAVDAGDNLMDIESCIDNPILAPLGRHVNKRRSSSKRIDKDHIDINVVHPESSASFIQEQERESRAPVTSLILRRRRLDCGQLDHYLQNLQPTLDPQTMSILQSPLLHLTELDLSRNRLASLPINLTSVVPFLIYLNLSHNQFAEIPMELCRLSQLQVLIMSQNRIEGAVPHEICSSLTQLKTLRLCANQITALPHTLARLDRLESLSMGSVYGGNLLTTFPPRCIQFMKALRELDLSHNKLCFLPADTGHPNSHLRQLVASDNKLEAIPKSIGLCHELRSLNLGRNQLTSLPTEIADLKQLDTLDLSENLLCVIPGDVADFLTKTTLLLTGNPFTRGYCDANRNPVSEIGGLGINYPTDDERYAAVLKNLSRRAILNSAASSSSSTSGHTPTPANLGSGRESPRPTGSSEHGYEMDQDERLDYHLYYTRHALSSRPSSRAESISSLNEVGGGGSGGSDYGSAYGGSWSDPYGPGAGASTPRANVEAVISDIDSFFDYIPSLASSTANSTTTTTTITPDAATTEPSIFEGTSLSQPTASLVTNLASLSLPGTPNAISPEPSQNYDVVTSHYDSRWELDSSTAPASSASSASSLPVTAPGPRFLPSLKELAARAVLYGSEPLPIGHMPELVVDYLQPGARPCGLCRGPYVKEWISSVRVKSYLGHPAVARRVRFCSSACWKTASEQLEAEESGQTIVSALSPGATTGHLPPVVRVEYDNKTDASGSSRVDDMNGLTSPDSTLPFPTTSSMSLASFQTLAQGMRVCKGGQTYWPVIARQSRLQTLSDTSLPPIAHTVDESGSITQTAAPSHRETNICSRGCLGGGVCEW
ncbi:hypothetical protein BG011_004898 [Mortierella polycephala]|uniref:L domain-like protein n=1 Tax=Mortierella polycephala TaxID=41804 RepID=A0A9P6U9S2_9FUNG|nr:hypothetical protein BG011_004898 [Mortierella polycephala]